ncbi:hypothetical protein [Vibrio parahaemolyticus]|uniref:hypothetical protein n=1 Tax=Vibrio parahaemolyticus TaxID=670 RepID=UPI0013754DD8|nr:hypothetical protein [Vibrio parahaemolyticus]MBM5145951.1 hypothetical protein [Vibrio parahaemolyticus]MBM5220156.1 hypothetical protein [Vibrio parahaemolyticus]MBM5230327.1 hypothetical protein [Vibrio parahaemolyticus]MBM5233348.1 hypothetical protein [Vibrio parahaemolyticus]MBM5239407.1 hypothetical protein [Vibrio parahaemolyticus]
MVKRKNRTTPIERSKSSTPEETVSQEEAEPSRQKVADTTAENTQKPETKANASKKCTCGKKWNVTLMPKAFMVAYLLVFIGVMCAFGFEYVVDFIAVTIIGVAFSAIELASRYRDDPSSVLQSSPGRLYLVINGLICIAGLYLVLVFKIGYQVDDYLDDTAQRVADVIQASLASFLVMRSSFLRLGQNNEWDLGLNAVLKKLLHIVDREVDRRRAVTRSKDIVKMFKDLKIEYTEFVFLFCLQAMQNVEPDEIKEINIDIKSLTASEEFQSVEAKKTQQLGIGLRLYSIVGKEVLEAAVQDVCSFITPEESQASSSYADDLSEIDTELLEEEDSDINAEADTNKKDV